MNKLRKILSTKINFKVMTVFTIVLTCVLLCTTIITNYYSTRFIKDQRVKYNAKVMSKVIYDLDALNSQINQFLNNYNRQSQYQDVYHFKTQIFDFNSLKEQIDFETEAKNKIYVNNLQSIIKDIVFYFNDSNMINIGDSVFDSRYCISESEWYQTFEKTKKQYMIYGPILENYRTENTVKEDVLLYISKIVISPSSNIKTEKKPFIMVCVKFSSVQDIFEQLFSGSRGIVVSDSKGNIVYTSNVSEEKTKTLNQQNNIKELKKGNKDYLTYSKDGMFITSMYANKYDWVISTVDSTNELFQDVEQLVNTINIIVALFGILGILISQIVIKRLMMPIHVLNHLINTIEEEKDTYIDVTTNDEIGQIGNRFNLMKKRIQELSERMYLSEVRTKEAQISALQAQINPHFLYNTLDNIYCIAQIEEIAPIIQLTQGLSSIMRYSIDCKDMYTIISEEIKHVQAYISIINIRYDNGINIKLNIEEGLESARTFKLLLQPIVENAWVHGILPKENPSGIISIQICRKEDRLEIIVEDDGVGITDDTLQMLNHSFESFTKVIRTPANKGFGIALINVNDRIKLIDGDQYGIHIESVKGLGSRVIIHIKYQEFK